MDGGGGSGLEGSLKMEDNATENVRGRRLVLLLLVIYFLLEFVSVTIPLKRVWRVQFN